MNDADIELRNRTYARFVELGRAPQPEELGSRDEVLEAWLRLHDAHALVLNASGELRMLNPFSAVPTASRVYALRRWWYANCAWDAFGICAALHSEGMIKTSCPDCRQAISVLVRERRPTRDDLVFHCLVPAARWWDDIAFT